MTINQPDNSSPEAGTYERGYVGEVPTLTYIQAHGEGQDAFVVRVTLTSARDAALMKLPFYESGYLDEALEAGAATAIAGISEVIRRNGE